MRRIILASFCIIVRLNLDIALCLDGDEVSKTNFPLPNLTERLQKCSAALHNGRGFFVIRGLDMSRYTVEDSVVIYLGIASHIADQRGIQDQRGNVLSVKTHIILHQRAFANMALG